MSGSKLASGLVRSLGLPSGLVAEERPSLLCGLSDSSGVEAGRRVREVPASSFCFSKGTAPLAWATLALLPSPSLLRVCFAGTGNDKRLLSPSSGAGGVLSAPGAAECCCTESFLRGRRLWFVLFLELDSLFYLIFKLFKSIPWLMFEVRSQIF